MWTRPLVAAFTLLLVACSSDGPAPPLPTPGAYALSTVNGAPIPFFYFLDRPIPREVLSARIDLHGLLGS
jgi:hypothetical protein